MFYESMLQFYEHLTPRAVYQCCLCYQPLCLTLSSIIQVMCEGFFFLPLALWSSPHSALWRHSARGRAACGVQQPFKGFSSSSFSTWRGCLPFWELCLFVFLLSQMRRLIPLSYWSSRLLTRKQQSVFPNYQTIPLRDGSCHIKTTKSVTGQLCLFVFSPTRSWCWRDCWWWRQNYAG